MIWPPSKIRSSSYFYSREEVLAMAARVREEIGLPDVLVNNAGSFYLQVLLLSLSLTAKQNKS